MNSRCLVRPSLLSLQGFARTSTGTDRPAHALFFSLLAVPTRFRCGPCKVNCCPAAVSQREIDAYSSPFCCNPPSLRFRLSHPSSRSSHSPTSTRTRLVSIRCVWFTLVRGTWCNFAYAMFAGHRALINAQIDVDDEEVRPRASMRTRHGMDTDIWLRFHRRSLRKSPFALCPPLWSSRTARRVCRAVPSVGQAGLADTLPPHSLPLRSRQLLRCRQGQAHSQFKCSVVPTPCASGLTVLSTGCPRPSRSSSRSTRPRLGVFDTHAYSPRT